MAPISVFILYLGKFSIATLLPCFKGDRKAANLMRVKVKLMKLGNLGRNFEGQRRKKNRTKVNNTTSG